MQKCTILIFFLAMVSADYVDAAEIIPCGPMSVGSMWRYSEQNTLGSSEVKRLVVSNEAGMIVISDSYRHNFSRAPMKQEQRSTFQEENGRIVLKEISVQDGLFKKKLDQPVCGYPDPEATFVGIEMIQVPAGSFEAQVFEVERDGSPTGEAGSTLGRQWVTIYHVPDIGTVKSIMVAEVHVPQITRSSDPNAETKALIEDGIAAMQKGEDASKIFEELAKLPQPAAEVGPSVSTKMQTNTITRELIEYAIE